jgi:bifunctional oligoribonuclease and PAP phosphatase NrnA
MTKLSIRPELERKFALVAKTLKSAKSVFIVAHLNPDGDTIGAMLTLGSVLLKMKKRVYMYSQDEIPKNLRFLKLVRKVHEGKLPKDKNFDAAVLMECSTPSRGGNVKEVLANTKTVVNIDHHKTAKNYGHINIVELKVSSVSELMFYLFQEMNVKLTPEEATGLYVGIAIDTGRFHYASASPRTMEITSRLLSYGAKAPEANTHLYATKEFPALKILGTALDKLKLLHNGKTAVTEIRKSDMKKAGALRQHLENIINYGLMVPGVKVSLIFREEGDHVAANFRSKGNFDVSKIAQKFGGGGHRNAAGAKLKKPIKEVRKNILKIISDCYKGDDFCRE